MNIEAMEKLNFEIGIEPTILNDTVEQCQVVSAVYFVIVGKINNNIQLTVNYTNDINIALSNNVVSNYYMVDKISEFYEFLRKHPIIKDKLNDNDIYILSDSQYKQLVKLAKKQHIYYNKAEIKIISDPTPKLINISRGNKIQKYSLDGILLKTYVGIRDATRGEDISDTSLKTAILNKTIYAGFRWLYLERTLSDDTVQEIGGSVTVNKHKKSLIAMIDIDRTFIVTVFENQKSAGLARKLKSSSAIYQSIVKGNLCSGHYFQYYEDCDIVLKQDYLNRVGGVLPNNSNKGIIIKQIDHITGIVIKEFPSIIDVQKIFQMSNKCIKKAIMTGEIIKGFKWAY